MKKFTKKAGRQPLCDYVYDQVDALSGKGKISERGKRMIIVFLFELDAQ